MKAAIVGVGLHPFGRYDGKSALQMGGDAIRLALADAGCQWSDVQAAYAGSFEATNADAVVSQIGLTGLPVRVIFNGCATGNALLASAAEAIEHGEHDVVVAVGMDKHPRGAFSADPEASGHPDWYGEAGLFLTTHYFGMKINRYMHEFGISHQTLARVAAKNLRIGERNPKAWRRKALSEEEILASPMLNYPLRQYMFCGPDEGAAAVVLTRPQLAHKFAQPPVYVRAAELRTRRVGAFELMCTSLPLDRVDGPTQEASRAAFEKAGIGPEDVNVIQLQDTDAGSEIIHMAENGFCADGDQEKLVAAGDTEIGGRLPINTDGGLIANGEPMAASGLRQVYELVHQLRGSAGDRQVPDDPSVGYAHLYGAPGAAGCAILSR